MESQAYFPVKKGIVTMSEGKESGDNPLKKAIHDLEKAEEHLEHGDRVAAKHDMEDAIQKIEEAQREDGDVEVHVTHVSEAEKVTFREKLTATLQQVWDKAYVELKVPKKPKDIFQTAGEHPKSLMNSLNLTLEQARHQHVIDDFRFGIATETGGA